MTGAFPDPSVRDALLAELLDPPSADLPLLRQLAPRDADELDAFAARTGFAPAFVLLVMALNGRDTASSFLPDLVAALPAGSDTRRLAHAWLTRVWAALKGENDDRRLEAAVADVLALADWASCGDAVADAEWRAARTAVRRLDDPEARRVAEVIAAAAWDPDAVPGAYADVVSAWQNLVEQRTDATLGWTPALDALFQSHENSMYRYAASLAGPLPDDADDDAVNTHFKRYREGIAEYRTKHLPDLPDRDRLQEAAADECQDRARSLMISVIEAPAIPA